MRGLLGIVRIFCAATVVTELIVCVADGLNPRHAARRMVKWQQEAVVVDPPAFQHHKESSKL